MFPMSVLATSPTSAYAGTGANNNSNGGSTSWGWTNPSWATGAPDGSSAYYGTPSGDGFSQYLLTTNFGFSIPTNATITDIKVEEYNGCYGYTGSCGEGVILWKNAAYGTAYGIPLTLSGIGWQTSAGTGLWGGTWTPTDINASTFGVASWVGFTSGQNHDIYIDSVKITITYTVGSSIIRQIRGVGISR